jgi:RNA polymerase sigma-70 factor (TIGR02957 family)
MIDRVTDEELLDELRPGAFAIAYRMLGTVSEAEDVVQEALLRFHRAQAEGQRIESPRAFVSTVVTRLGIDQLRSARRRRETYVGEWLPEPLLTSDEEDPAQQAEMADSLSLAFLVLLESLSPEQRAVFLLHDVFDYPYDEVARIVGKSEANARQLAARARRHVDERRPRFEATREQHEKLADRFFAAMEEGDVKSLEAMLAEDVVLAGDGGGKAPALARAVHGARRVARILANWGRQAPRIGGVTIRREQVNGQPGAIMLASEDNVIAVVALDIAEGRVQGMRSIVNPEKLQHVGPVADLWALQRAARAQQARGRGGADEPVS